MGSRAASWALNSAPRGLLARAMPDMHCSAYASEKFSGARVAPAHPPMRNPTNCTGLHSWNRSLAHDRQGALPVEEQGLAYWLVLTSRQASSTTAGLRGRQPAV